MGYLIILLSCLPVAAQSITVSKTCIGVIQDANDPDVTLGTAFFAGKHGRIITAAHVVATGKFKYNGAGTSLKPVALKLAYQLTDVDLAVFEPAQECKGCVTCDKPLQFGDAGRIRPGDKLFYLGWTASQGYNIQANLAEVQATGSALNGISIIRFFEFSGVGLPGYSGGPVIATDGKIVGVMREAWVKQGVKGGDQLLMNRAFSIEPVKIREEQRTTKPEEKK